MSRFFYVNKHSASKHSIVSFFYKLKGVSPNDLAELRIKPVTPVLQGKLATGCSRWKNMEVFEGKALYFYVGGGEWVVLQSNGWLSLWKCDSVGGCPSQKCSSMGIFRSNGILSVIWVLIQRRMRKNHFQFFKGGSPEKKNELCGWWGWLIFDLMGGGLKQ